MIQPPPPVDDVNFGSGLLRVSPSSLNLSYGKSEQLTTRYNDSIVTPVYSVEDESLAAVSETGLVQVGDKPGKTYIYAVFGVDTAVCRLNVVEPVDITELSIAPEHVSIKIGEKYELNASYNDDATETELTWTSSDEGVARVDENGVVSGRGLGTVTITATSGSGLTATCQLTVTNALVFATVGDHTIFTDGEMPSFDIEQTDYVDICVYNPQTGREIVEYGGETAFTNYASTNSTNEVGTIKLQTSSEGGDNVKYYWRVTLKAPGTYSVRLNYNDGHSELDKTVRFSVTSKYQFGSGTSGSLKLNSSSSPYYVAYKMYGYTAQNDTRVYMERYNDRFTDHLANFYLYKDGVKQTGSAISDHLQAVTNVDGMDFYVENSALKLTASKPCQGTVVLQYVVGDKTLCREEVRLQIRSSVEWVEVKSGGSKYADGVSETNVAHFTWSSCNSISLTVFGGVSGVYPRIKRFEGWQVQKEISADSPFVSTAAGYELRDFYSEGKAAFKYLYFNSTAVNRSISYDDGINTLTVRLDFYR